MASLAAQLASLLATVQRPGDFFVAGRTELPAPSLVVEGVGPVALPLLPMQAEQLVRAGVAAPFGRGEATVIDPAVRRCWQIGPERVQLSGRRWARTLDGIVQRAAEGLGVSDPISAEFYKLLVYDTGSFFISHRDTEKAPGMFATLVVVLPSPFAGGDLLVRHKGREIRLDLRPDDPGEAAFVAFYADCVHEILPVTEGWRLALTFNLRRAGRGPAPKPPDHTAEQDKIAAVLKRWRASKDRPTDTTPEKLVYPLEHAYTPAELGFPMLKGSDAAAASVVTDAAARAGCDLHLAMLTVEESGAAEYSGDFSGGGWHEDDFEAGEVFDRAVTLSDWRTAQGATSLGAIPVEDEEISPPDAMEDFAPDEEEFHEATGNEGVSFERSYRRAALVLWPGGRTYAVLSQAGLTATLPFLDELVRRASDAGEETRAALREDACELARHMLAQWPRREWHDRDAGKPSDSARMLDLLARLDADPMIARFLLEITAAGDYRKSDNPHIITALDRLPTARRAELIEAVVSGTASTSFKACADLLARAAAAWPGAEREGPSLRGCGPGPASAAGRSQARGGTCGVASGCRRGRGSCC